MTCIISTCIIIQSQKSCINKSLHREKSVLLRILNLSNLEAIKVGDTLEFSKKLSPQTVNVTIDDSKLNFSALTIEDPKSQLLINSHQVRHNPVTQTVALSQTLSYDNN